ncbi:hypothetical protein PMIN03_012720 [Paraphaeosphaeria minitans]
MLSGSRLWIAAIGSDVRLASRAIFGEATSLLACSAAEEGKWLEQLATKVWKILHSAGPIKAVGGHMSKIPETAILKDVNRRRTNVRSILRNDWLYTEPRQIRALGPTRNPTTNDDLDR